MYVQYKEQFADTRRAAGDGSDSEEGFVQEPTSRRKGKGKRKKRGAQKGGHGVKEGRPTFVTASEVLTGSKAFKTFKAYRKTKKGKPAVARKKTRRRRGKAWEGCPTNNDFL